MTDDRMQLTRRKILAGTAAVGAAGVGAGLGTSALFSDEESFEGNIVAAGELDMAVAAHVKAQNPEMPSVEIDGNGEGTTQDTADGNTVTITATDMKPGDWFIIQWEASVCDNPAYVEVTSVDEEFENLEGDNPEPEGDTSAPGDLGQALLTSIWNQLDNSGDPTGLYGGLDETTDLEDSGLMSYESPDLDGVTDSGAHYTTMDEAHDVYSTGVTIDDPSTGEDLVVGCEQGEWAVYYQLFELPLNVGNDVQGDSVSWTLEFNAEQVRNNDDPFSS